MMRGNVEMIYAPSIRTSDVDLDESRTGNRSATLYFLLISYFLQEPLQVVSALLHHVNAANVVPSS